MKWPSAKTNRGNTKEILQTKSGTLGGAGDPPWWFFRVNFFIRFLDVSPPNKNSQTNGFSPKFPTFFLCKKNQIESDGWTSLVDGAVQTQHSYRIDHGATRTPRSSLLRGVAALALCGSVRFAAHRTAWQ